MSTTWPSTRRINIRDLQAAKDRNEKWAMLTCYDSLTAAIFEHSGVRVLLVGDSVANTVLGHDSTIPVTLDQMIVFASGVTRSTSSALVVGDMPFGSYQSSPTQAIESATRLFKEANVGAVKLEGGETVAGQVDAITSAGMPVMGHIGLTPQSVHALGGHRVQGRGNAGDRLISDALALQQAGAFAIVAEAIPVTLTKRLTQQVKIPVIGIGAGPDCDAQVLVWQDMAGLNTGKTPKFVKKFAELGSILSSATQTYVQEVQTGEFPAPDHCYE